MTAPSRTDGVVVVTAFDCPGRWALLIMVVMHRRLKRDVRRQATGFLGVTTVVEWRRRRLLNISLWENADAVYSMGRVSRHVAASRLPARLGVVTSGAVYGRLGDWRTVMFGTPDQGRLPFGPRVHPTNTANDTT